MLRKRTRSHQKDQQMGHLIADVVSEPLSQFDVLGQKEKTKSFFNVPGLFVGLTPKASESDSIRSPTSPLDLRGFSKLGNPIRSPKSSFERNQKSWDGQKVGLSIIDSLDDETKLSGKVLRSSDSKNILFGPQLRIKTPNFQRGINSFEAPKSLPKDYAIFPHTFTKRSNLQVDKSDILSRIGEDPLEPKSFEKILSCSLDSGRSDVHLAGLTSPETNLSCGKFCMENETTLMSRGSLNLSSSLGTKLASLPLSVGSAGNGFIGSLSASEIERSEDYTCVRKSGPNPKTTHIFGDCILECHNNEFTIFPKNEEKETALPQSAKSSEVPPSYPSNDFLSFCYCCKKKLEGKDIYMYRGEKAFCSCSCRSEEILIEEAMEKTNNNSSEDSFKSDNDEELFETSMFIAT